MKTQFFNFGGGVVAGLILAMSLSASRNHDESLASAFSVPAPLRPVELDMVPIKEFYKDVARYKTTHVKTIEKIMLDSLRPDIAPWAPAGGGGKKKSKEPSRMFIYSVQTLEKFFSVIRECAANADISEKDLAIRFYYGVYPRTKQIAPQTDYGSLHTLFMVPNYWDGERYRDIELKGLSDYVVKHHGYGNESKADVISRHYLYNMYKGNKESVAFMLDASAVKWTSMSAPQRAGFFTSVFEEPPVINQGGLCPPSCPNTTTTLEEIDGEFPNVYW